MAITSKSFKSTVSQGKVDVNIDLEKELEGLTRSQRTTLKKIVAETALAEVLRMTAKKESSVNQSGSNSFKKLSKEYRKKKLAAGKGGQPNLKLTDEMLESLFTKAFKDSVSLKITDKLSKKKAENHNKGVTLPKRQYLPTKDGQGFRREIMKVINEKVREYKKSIK